MSDLPYTTAEAAVLLEEAAKKEKLSPLEKAALKKTLEDVKALQETVQDMQGKALKIYYVEDDNISVEELVNADGLLDALGAREYQAVRFAVDDVIYYVVGNTSDYVKLVTFNTNMIDSVAYNKDEDTWSLSDDNNDTYTIDLRNVKSLYFHPITVTLTDHFAFSIIIIDNNAQEYNTGKKLKDKIDHIKNSRSGVARFPATGSFISNGTIYPIYNLEVPADNAYRLYFFNGTTTLFMNISLTAANINVYDGVDKIN